MPMRGQRGRLRLVDTGKLASTPEDDAGESLARTPVVGAVAAEPEWTDPPVAPSEAKPRRSRPSAAPAGATLGVLGALPDAQLVALGSKGDTRALEVLYRRHAAFAIQLATRIEGSARDVEDIVHDAFIRAFERLSDLADASAFRGWLGAIVVHAVRSRMRRHRLMSLLGLGRGVDPVELDALASPEASPHVRAQLAQIYALLRTLPPDDRIAWTLRAVEGHDLDTVARLTRCSLATVKRRIGRAQRFLDEHFVDPHHNEKEPES